MSEFPAKGHDGFEWPATADGMAWAIEFNKRFPAVSVDDALGWMSNAIMKGVDSEAARREAEPTSHLGVIEFNGQRFVGGSAGEMIDALVHALRLNGVVKLEGTGWRAETRDGPSIHGLLVDALRARIGSPPAAVDRVAPPVGVASSDRGAVEATARRIYAAMQKYSDKGRTMPWVDGGNSLAQEEARACARDVLRREACWVGATPAGYIAYNVGDDGLPSFGLFYGDPRGATTYYTHGWTPVYMVLGHRATEPTDATATPSVDDENDHTASDIQQIVSRAFDDWEARWDRWCAYRDASRGAFISDYRALGAWLHKELSEHPVDEATARDAKRWRAVKAQMIAADFNWGERGQVVVICRVPMEVSVSADPNHYADQLVRAISIREHA